MTDKLRIVVTDSQNTYDGFAYFIHANHEPFTQISKSVFHILASLGFKVVDLTEKTPGKKSS